MRESAERRKAQARTGQMGGIALALQSAALSEDALRCAITMQFCVLLRNGWDGEEKRR